MKIIVVTSQKGGSGKTTLTANLSVAAEHAKNGPVVMIDTDPQGTLATWWDARDSETPQLAPIPISELSEKIKALDKAGFTYCFIDTPPALTAQSQQALALADFVLIPIRPTPNDLWSLGATLTLVKQSAVPFAFIVNQAKNNARITIQSVAALSDHGSVLQEIIHDRVDYPMAMTDGRTVIETNPSGASALETEALWRLVHDKINEITKNSELAIKKRRIKTHA